MLGLIEKIIPPGWIELRYAIGFILFWSIQYPQLDSGLPVGLPDSVTK
jgi:hypothetical protein